MKRNYASVKVEKNTYEFLKHLKQTEGIPITESIRIAVDKAYNTKEKRC